MNDLDITLICVIHDIDLCYPIKFKLLLKIAVQRKYQIQNVIFSFSAAILNFLDMKTNYKFFYIKQNEFLYPNSPILYAKSRFTAELQTEICQFTCF